MEVSINTEESQVSAEVASFGGALLLRDSKGRHEIVGGTDAEKRRAKKWAENNCGGVRWYSRTFTKRIRLPLLRQEETPADDGQ